MIQICYCFKKGRDIAYESKRIVSIVEIITQTFKETYYLMRTPSQRYARICTPLILLILVAFLLAACGGSSSSGDTSNNGSSVTVHLGYFPNLTHAIALVGVAQGTFKKALGS